MSANSVQTALICSCRDGRWPRPVPLAGADPVLDPGVRPVPGLEELGLPAAGVAGDRLVAKAVADLEGVQRRAGVR